MVTYHHSTSFPRGGRQFKLKYNDNPEETLQQSANGQSPDPPLIHTEEVKSTDDGKISFTMETIGTGSAHMDLNALSIKEVSGK